MRVHNANSAELSSEAMDSGLAVLARYCEIQYGFVPESTTTETLEPVGDCSAGLAETRDFRKRERWSVKFRTFIHRKPVRCAVFLLVVILYAVVGGLVFHWCEAEAELAAELDRKAELETRKLELMEEIVKFIENDKQNCTELLNAENGCSHETHTLTDIISDFVQQINQNSESEYKFSDFLSCTFFASTLFTTIGYGNMTPRTFIGRLVTIMYSFIGIPLFVMILQLWGETVFGYMKVTYFGALGTARRVWRTSRRRLQKTGKNKIDVQIQSQTGSCTNVDRQRSNESSKLVNFFEDTVPFSIAFITILGYIIVCSLMFKAIEPDWDLFTAFYYFYISFSTIGLGDFVPRKPVNAIAAFLLFVLGLSLIGVVASVMGAKLEARYMAALRLIEQQAQSDRNDALRAASAVPPTESVNDDGMAMANIIFTPPNQLATATAVLSPTAALATTVNTATVLTQQNGVQRDMMCENGGLIVRGLQPCNSGRSSPLSPIIQPQIATETIFIGDGNRHQISVNDAPPALYCLVKGKQLLARIKEDTDIKRTF